MQMIFYVFYIDFIPTAELNLISILKKSNRFPAQTYMYI